MFAQQSHENRADFFAGYQFTRFNRIDNLASVHDVLKGNGWNAALEYELNGWLGMKADFSGAYATDHSAGQNNGGVDLLTYAVGPVFSSHASSNVTPFAEVLIGGYRETPAQADNTLNGLALLAGVGLDARVNHRFAIRVFDLDWLRYATGNQRCVDGQCQAGKNNLRFSAGAVIHF